MNPSQPAAALDIGSNSVHLLVARQDADGAPVPLLDVSHQAGIGGVVDATGALGPALRDELVAVVATFMGQARVQGAEHTMLLGTEALRNAADAGLVVDAVRAATGASIMILDRASEGLLTLLGVSQGRVPASLAVIDIGGGSTQVTIARPDGPPALGLLPVGSARLAAAHIRHDPVTHAEVAALRHAARAHVSALRVPHVARAIVAGGSGTNVSRLLGRERMTPLDPAALAAALDLLMEYPAAALAQRSGLTVRRVAQLAAGLAIGEALFERLGLGVAEVSDASLREGALIAGWRLEDRWLDDLSLLLGGGHAPHQGGLTADDRDRAS